MALVRRGSCFGVSRATTALPNHCIKCGETGIKTLQKTYQWHNPFYYLLLLLCLWAYAFAIYFVARRMVLKISLCRRHANRRLTLLIVGTILLLGSIPLGYFLGRDPGVLVGIFGFLAGLIVLVIGTNTIRPVGMTDLEATYAGAGEGFLRRLSGS